MIYWLIFIWFAPLIAFITLWIKLVVFIAVAAMKAVVSGIKYALKLVGILFDKLQTKLKNRNSLAI